VEAEPRRRRRRGAISSRELGEAGGEEDGAEASRRCEFFFVFLAGGGGGGLELTGREQKHAETRTRHVETPGSAHDTRQPRIGGPYMNRRQDGCGGADPTRYMK